MTKEFLVTRRDPPRELTTVREYIVWARAEDARMWREVEAFYEGCLVAMGDLPSFDTTDMSPN